MEYRDIYARIVKIIGTRYPRLRPMIRNHPYTKIVGIAIAKCLLDEMRLSAGQIDDATLETVVDKGIALYHAHEEELKNLDVLAHKRALLCEEIKQIALSSLPLAG
ncbi:MAG: hypothetical protein GXO33_07115 [Epsilonproteobacteria bacterium]|nr:hypothetical protein [Campylobacterota bacterium]